MKINIQSEGKRNRSRSRHFLRFSNVKTKIEIENFEFFWHPSYTSHPLEFELFKATVSWYPRQVIDLLIPGLEKSFDEMATQVFSNIIKTTTFNEMFPL
jgi:hypothetical protein